MLVEKRTAKILSSVGAICKNNLNTHLFTCRSYGASDFLLLYYKHLTPPGSTTSYFMGFNKKKPTLENFTKGGSRGIFKHFSTLKPEEPYFFYKTIFTIMLSLCFN
jgi:hypothetical protein